MGAHAVGYGVVQGEVKAESDCEYDDGGLEHVLLPTHGYQGRHTAQDDTWYTHNICILIFGYYQIISLLISWVFNYSQADKILLMYLDWDSNPWANKRLSLSLSYSNSSINRRSVLVMTAAASRLTGRLRVTMKRMNMAMVTAISTDFLVFTDRADCRS